MSEDLKPCPFCGSAAEIITLAGECGPDDPSVGAQCVQCTSSACGTASGLIYPLMDDVTHLLMERWNKRTENEASRLRAENALLVAKAQRLQGLLDAAHKIMGELARPSGI